MEEKTTKNNKEVTKVNPLRNERVFVRFIPHNEKDLPKDHVMYGGRIDGASSTFVVPMLSNGTYKNVLTNAEKDFLEKALGLDDNALSVYKTENNYWDNFSVFIQNAKEGLHLDLSDPVDYIKYKVLLANTEQIAPSVQERMDRPNQTYQFEIVREAEDTDIENAKMDATMDSYMELKKIDSDLDTMRVLAELLDNRPYAQNSGKAFFRARLNAAIQKDPKGFIMMIKDPALHAKVLLRRGTELGVLNKRGDYYYLKSDGSPLCDPGEDPTLSIAARFINQPTHQDIKFLLESALEKGIVK